MKLELSLAKFSLQIVFLLLSQKRKDSFVLKSASWISKQFTGLGVKMYFMSVFENAKKRVHVAAVK